MSRKRVRKSFDQSQSIRNEFAGVPIADSVRRWHSGTCGCYLFPQDGQCENLVRLHWEELATTDGQGRARAWLNDRAMREVDAKLGAMTAEVERHKAGQLAREAQAEEADRRHMAEAMALLGAAVTAGESKAQKEYVKLSGKAAAEARRHAAEYPAGRARLQVEAERAAEVAEYVAWEKSLSPEARTEWRNRRRTEGDKGPDGQRLWGPSAYYTLRLRPPGAAYRDYDPPLQPRAKGRS